MSHLLDFFTSDLFIQSLGFIGISAGLVSFHMKKRSGILMFQIICCLLFTTQLTLLDAYSGALINCIGILRGILYSLKGKYKWAESKIIPYTMIALFIATGIVTSTVEGPIALLPSLAMTVQSIAQFLRDERRIRIMSLFCSPFWIIYHVAVGSLGGWIGETFMLISISLSLITTKKRDTDTADSKE